VPAELQFLALDDFDAIASLITDGIEESLNLEYKASPALARDSAAVNEMCKDVSAFANSAGGQIVYGIGENRDSRKPAAGDPGVTDPKITREWIEQILNSKIQPRISGVRTGRINNDQGGAVFVITIPASQSGPHQAPDKRYYKRFDLQSVPMEDYEIRDVMRRATTPDLVVDLTFATGNTQRIDYAPQQELSKPFPLIPWVSNRSAQPAEYAVIDIGIDPQLSVLMTGDYEPIGRHGDPRGIQLQWCRFMIRPPRVPIFREHKQKLTTGDLCLGFHSGLLHGEKLFDFATKIAVPVSRT
jgi:hypothetical protein